MPITFLIPDEERDAKDKGEIHFDTSTVVMKKVDLTMIEKILAKENLTFSEFIEKWQQQNKTASLSDNNTTNTTHSSMPHLPPTTPAYRAFETSKSDEMELTFHVVGPGDCNAVIAEHLSTNITNFSLGTRFVRGNKKFTIDGKKDVRVTSVVGTEMNGKERKDATIYVIEAKDMLIRYGEGSSGTYMFNTLRGWVREGIIASKADIVVMTDYRYLLRSGYKDRDYTQMSEALKNCKTLCGVKKVVFEDDSDYSIKELVRSIIEQRECDKANSVKGTNNNSLITFSYQPIPVPPATSAMDISSPFSHPPAKPHYIDVKLPVDVKPSKFPSKPKSGKGRYWI